MSPERIYTRNTESNSDEVLVSYTDAAEIIGRDAEGKYLLPPSTISSWCKTGSGYRLVTPTKVGRSPRLTKSNIKTLWVALNIKNELKSYSSLSDIGGALSRHQLMEKYLQGEEWNGVVERAREFEVDLSEFTKE